MADWGWHRYTTTYKTEQTKAYYIAQETLLNTLRWPIQEKNLKKELVCVYAKLIHLAVHLKIIQHGNYAPTKIKNKIRKQKHSNHEYVDSIIIPLIPRGEKKTV